MNEADILIASFASDFTNKVSQAPMIIERVQEGKNNQQYIRIQSWSTWELLTHTSPGDQMGCIQGSGDNWLMPLQGCSLSSLKGCGDQAVFLMTGEKQTLHIS